ncbi:MAG TPA: sigma factor, partial [Phycisphaerae bacterium]|nr:sigma factor [Phycisphaerae bacterium]
MDRREYAPTIPEHDLIARCKRGEREAQRALYEQTCERVLRLLQRMTHSPETAEDLAQETYLKAFSAI